MRNITKFTELVRQSNGVAFFGGAGVSTESGIPDFRSKKSRQDCFDAFGLEPEQILSQDFFRANPEVFFQYLYHFLLGSLVPNVANPNPAHKVLAEWENQGILTGIVTQNIDGLHQRAGSKKVWELHGSLETFHCMRCQMETERQFVLLQLQQGIGVPTCPCGGTLKPNIVLYGEMLPDTALIGAQESISKADLLVVAGTSLTVYPAAGLVEDFRGEHLVVVNLSPVPVPFHLKGKTIVINQPVGEVLADVNVGMPGE
jgi:NAD-dependent protein deacetylases, SIR2 family